MASVTLPAMTASHKAICSRGITATAESGNADAAGEALPPAGPTAAGRAGDDLVAGQTHHAAAASTSAIAPAAAIVAGAMYGRRGGRAAAPAGGSSATISGRKAKTRTDRAIFLTLCSPLSSNGYGSLSLIWSRTTREMQIPPGSASASRRAATLTPSP